MSRHRKFHIAKQITNIGNGSWILFYCFTACCRTGKMFSLLQIHLLYTAHTVNLFFHSLHHLHVFYVYYRISFSILYKWTLQRSKTKAGTLLKCQQESRKIKTIDPLFISYNWSISHLLLLFVSFLLYLLIVYYNLALILFRIIFLRTNGLSMYISTLSFPIFSCFYSILFKHLQFQLICISTFAPKHSLSSSKSWKTRNMREKEQTTRRITEKKRFNSWARRYLNGVYIKKK